MRITIFWFPLESARQLHNLIKLKSHCADRVSIHKVNPISLIWIFRSLLALLPLDVNFFFIFDCAAEEISKRDCMTVNYNRNGKKNKTFPFEQFTFIYILTVCLELERVKRAKSAHRMKLLSFSVVLGFIILKLLPWPREKPQRLGLTFDWIFFTTQSREVSVSPLLRKAQEQTNPSNNW